MRSTILAAKRSRALRRSLTLPEGLLGQALRRDNAGFRFRRQHAMGVYILDFYCPAAKLAVEVDGAGHDHPEQAAHDHRRDAWLETQGVRVLRFSADAVLDDFGLRAVVGMIAEAAAERS